MANNTLFSNKDVQNNVSRNGFDLSKRVLFTAKVGELLPIYHKRVMPGDKFSIDLNSFTRTQPVNTAAYTRIKEYYDFFYIPYRLLWRNAPASLTQMSSVANTVSLSPTQSLNANQNVPYFPKDSFNSLIGSFVEVMTSSFPETYLKNQFGFYRAHLSFKLLSYLGYFNYNDEQLSQQNFPTVYKDVCAFPLLAYQKIYYDFFRNPQWEHNRPECYNVDYLTTSTDLFTLFGEDVTDGSAFWQSSNMFDMRYCNYEKDMFTGALPNTQFGSESVLNISGLANNFTGTAQLEANVLREKTAVIYANGFGVKAERPANTDQYPGGNFETNDASPLYAIGGTTPISGYLAVNNSNPIPVDVKSLTGEIQSQLSILALRRATALQKYKEISQLGNTTYRAQIKKHFGVDIPESLGTMCTYIGGFQNAISINEVVNQNLDSSNSSALIRGKGTSIQLDNNPIDFDVKEHGIIMCVYHAVPLMDYSITGQSRDITAVDVTDYAIPEFDRLGLEPADVREFFQGGVSTSPSIYGYLPRYYSYKTDVDTILGAFNTTLPQWTAPYTKDYIKGYLDNPATVTSMYNSFKVNPTILNRIFPVAVDSTVDTDQLLCTAQFSIHAVRNLDFNGLPY